MAKVLRAALHAQRTLRSPDATLVELIVSQPGMIERLAEAHADDGRGRCKSCSAGAQPCHYSFPCLIMLAVEEAAGRIAVRQLARIGASRAALRVLNKERDR